MNATNRLNGWQRLLILLAIIWAILVVAFTVTRWPKTWQTEAEIRSHWVSHWANDRIAVFEKYEGNGEPFDVYRGKVFAGKSDEEIVNPRGFDIFTAVGVDDQSPSFRKDRARTDEVIELDHKYSAIVNSLPRRSRAETVGIAFLAWGLPLAMLYLIGVGVHWVYEGFRRKSA